MMGVIWHLVTAPFPLFLVALVAGASAVVGMIDRAARRRNDAGASAVEYGLLIAGIALVCLLGARPLGALVSDIYTGNAPPCSPGHHDEICWQQR